jgi:hypothetical protein
LDRHVCHAGVPVSLPKDLDELSTAGEWVGVPGHDEDRQIGADAGKRLAVAEPDGRTEHGRNRIGVHGEPAQRVGDVLVNLGFVAAEPLISSAVIEAGVERT